MPIPYLRCWIIIRGSIFTGIGHHKRFRLSMASATLVKRSYFRADGERVLSTMFPQVALDQPAHPTWGFGFRRQLVCIPHLEDSQLKEHSSIGVGVCCIQYPVLFHDNSLKQTNFPVLPVGSPVE
jgi:hypothetical protein